MICRFVRKIRGLRQRRLVPDNDTIRVHLAKLLSDSRFRQRLGALTRSGQFLSFVVEETLGGRGEDLKEYRLGVEVFGRPPSFDPAFESNVRVEAGRLRTKLVEYYSAEGKPEPVRIDVPKGGYTATFAWAEDLEPVLAEPPVTVHVNNLGEPETMPPPIPLAQSDDSSRPGGRAVELTDVNGANDAAPVGSPGQWWKNSVLASADHFLSDLTRLLRHPIEFADTASRTGVLNTRYLILFLLLVVGLSASLFLLSGPRLPGLRSRLSLMLLALMGVGLPAEVLIVASLWKMVGCESFDRMLKVCAYLLSAQVLLASLFGLSEIVVRWSLENAGQAPFTYSSGAEATGQVLRDLGTCTEEHGFHACIDKTQPIGLSSATFWSRNVYQSPVFWLGVLIFLLGVPVQFVYNVATCRACYKIAEPRRFWSMCIIPFVFFIPGLFISFLKSGMASVIRDDSCSVAISRTPILNPGPIKYGPLLMCADFPLIDVALLTSTHWSRSAAEHDAGIEAKVGDSVALRLWFNNGAADNLDTEQMTARNVRVRVGNLRPNPNTLLLFAQAYGDNVPLIKSGQAKFGGHAKITTNVPVNAELVPSSICINRSHLPSKDGSLCNTSAGDVLLPDSSVSEWFNIGDIRPGYANGVQVHFRFRLRAVGTSPPK